MASTTTDSLLTLLDQLQSMETSLTDFIFETALRLSALTEAKLFLVIQSKAGNRRFCGHRDFVDVFHAGNGLQSEPTDDLVELNVDSPPLNYLHQQQHQQHQQPLHDNGRVDLYDEALESAVGVQAWTSRKRINIGNCESTMTTTTRKRLRTDFDSTPSSSSDEDRIVIEEVRTTRDRAILDHPRNNDDDDDLSVVVVKRETDEFIIEANEDGEFPPLQLDSQTGEKSFFVAPNDFERSGSSVEESPNKRKKKINNWKGRENSALVPPKNLHVKAHVLREIENPEMAFMKGSTENKLLTSVFYDFGKELGLNNPYVDKTFKNALSLKFYKLRLNAFIQTFPRLMVNRSKELTAMVRSNQRIWKADSYMEMNARGGYQRVLLTQGYTKIGAQRNKAS